MLLLFSEATSVYSFCITYRLWWSGFAWFHKGCLQNTQAINFSTSILTAPTAWVGSYYSVLRMRDFQAGRFKRLKNEVVHSSCLQRAGKRPGRLRLARPHLKTLFHSSCYATIQSTSDHLGSVLRVPIRMCLSLLMEKSVRSVCHFRLPPRCKWDLRSSGILRGVYWQLTTFRNDLWVVYSEAE